MRILFDECVPWPIHRILQNHQCVRTQRQGWAGLKNGDLLRLAEADFDVFLTADQGVRFQQNLTGFRIGILVLSTNKLRAILDAAALLQGAVESLRPGELRTLQIP